MAKKETGKYIFLNTFRPEVNILSNEAKKYHYMIGNKVCYGDFVVYSSQTKFKPIKIKKSVDNKIIDEKELEQKILKQKLDELSDEELSLKDIVPVIGFEGIYLPIYLKNKIGNARKKGKDELKNAIKIIVENYEKYCNLFKEDELYYIISAFFDLIYEEMIKLSKNGELKIEFTKIDNVKPLFTDWNSEHLNSYFYINKSFLKQINNNKLINNIFDKLLRGIGSLYTINFNIKMLSEDQNIRSSFYNMFYSLGLPYMINSELGDTVHLKNDFIANCYDSFIIIGVVIEMIKKINYPIRTDKYKEILSLTNLPDNMKKSELEKLLKDIAISEYEFISKITDTESKEISIDFGTDTKIATSTNNVLDFYYHYFFNHLETKEFMQSIKREELKKFKNTLKKSTYRSNKESYIRQLYQQQIDYNNFK